MVGAGEGDGVGVGVGVGAGVGAGAGAGAGVGAGVGVGVGVQLASTRMKAAINIMVTLLTFISEPPQKYQVECDTDVVYLIVESRKCRNHKIKGEKITKL